MTSYSVKKNHIFSPLDGVSYVFFYFTYEGKGEPYRFSSKRDPSVQTDRQTDKQTSCYFNIDWCKSFDTDSMYSNQLKTLGTFIKPI